MTGYVRKDTTNNIADGNVINAADLDSEFDGVQAAFNSSTGHTHDGSSAEGAPITKLGPVQDVTISTTVLGVKTTNTVDLGTSSLKFKDFYLAGNASIGGTLTYGGVTLSNAVTGTGSMVLSASPTITGTITAAAANFSGAVAFNGTTTIGDADTDTITQAASYVTGTQLKSAKTATNTLSLAAYDVDGTAYTNLITLTASNTPTLALTSTGVGTINNMSIGATTASTGAFTTLSANSTVTLSGGTINGVAYLNGTNVLTTGSALTFDGTTLTGTQSTAAQISLNNSSGNYLFLTGAGGNSYIDNRITGGTTNFRNGGAYTWSTYGGSDRMTLDSSGNLGLGVTPSAWNTSYKAFQFVAGSIASVTSGEATYLHNAFINTSGNYAYINAAAAARYSQSGGVHYWFNAPAWSGTGSPNISFTQAMTLDASGNLLVGITTNTGGARLEVLSNATSAYTARSSSSGASTTVKAVRSVDSSASNFSNAQYDALSHAWILSNTTQAMTLDSSGNVGVGVTPSSGWSGGFYAFQIGQVGAFASKAFSASNTQTFIGNNVYYNNSAGNYQYIATGSAAARYALNQATHIWQVAATIGTANTAISFIDAMTLDSNGNLVIGDTTANYRLDVKGSTGNGIAYRDGTVTAYMGTTGSNLMYSGTLTNHPLAFLTNATERARFNSTGALVFAGGTTSANGVGITFPATQSASSDANTLDDYEEGTWSPSIGGTATYTAQIGTYTKVGRLVTIQGDITINVIGTGSIFTISGLPFTASAQQWGSVGGFTGLNTGNIVFISCYVDSGTTNLSFNGLSAAGVTSGLLAPFKNGAQIAFSISYYF